MSARCPHCGLPYLPEARPVGVPPGGDTRIPVPVLIAKGLTDSEESAKSLARGTFPWVDPDQLCWHREDVPEMIGGRPVRLSIPEYPWEDIRPEHAARWVGMPRAKGSA